MLTGESCVARRSIAVPSLPMHTHGHACAPARSVTPTGQKRPRTVCHHRYPGPDRKRGPAMHDDPTLPDSPPGDVLGDLRWHWGEAYEITGSYWQWRAVRRDNGCALTADSADGLHDL